MYGDMYVAIALFYAIHRALLCNFQGSFARCIGLFWAMYRAILHNEMCLAPVRASLRWGIWMCIW